jgi:hypothetical protein
LVLWCARDTCQVHVSGLGRLTHFPSRCRGTCRMPWRWCWQWRSAAVGPRSAWRPPRWWWWCCRRMAAWTSCRCTPDEAGAPATGAATSRRRGRMGRGKRTFRIPCGGCAADLCWQSRRQHVVVCRALGRIGLCSGSLGYCFPVVVDQKQGLEASKQQHTAGGVCVLCANRRGVHLRVSLAAAHNTHKKTRLRSEHSHDARLRTAAAAG